MDRSARLLNKALADSGITPGKAVTWREMDALKQALRKPNPVKATEAVTRVRIRRTFYHEAAHWVHREGPKWYQELIRAHFEARTQGEAVVHLAPYGPGTRGKKDRWYEIYAGRTYDWERSRPDGVELPSRYFELLSLPSPDLAHTWNDPDVRETLLIVLRILF
ncbi:MAG: hypothetical protein J0M24_27145 [Verrucomicrobia bacterium]|nr:hypothetical protein [Verrucomicrobiota bacterium]